MERQTNCTKHFTENVVTLPNNKCINCPPETKQNQDRLMSNFLQTIIWKKNEYKTKSEMVALSNVKENVS